VSAAFHEVLVRNCAALSHKSMLDSGCSDETADDPVVGIDTEDDRGESAMWIISGNEPSIGHDNAMDLRPVVVYSNNLTTLINPERRTVECARNINARVFTLEEDESVVDAKAVNVGAHNFFV
jgi:hypothetical protein